MSERWRVYLSGPISLGGTASRGQIERYVERFAVVSDELERAGYEPLSPASIARNADEWGDSWADWMRRALTMMLRAHLVVLLPDWQLSRGSRLEAFIAGELGLQVMTLDHLRATYTSQSLGTAP